MRDCTVVGADLVRMFLVHALMRHQADFKEAPVARFLEKCVYTEFF